MGGGRRQREEGRKEGERGAPFLQNEGPTPQDGWEKLKNPVFLFLSNGGSSKCFDSNTAPTDLRIQLADAA
eukprot:3635414-Pyramimonas_sp.AAC.1